MKLGDNGEAFFVQEMDNDQVRVKTNLICSKFNVCSSKVSFEFRNSVEKYTFTHFMVLKVEIQSYAVCFLSC